MSRHAHLPVPLPCHVPGDAVDVSAMGADKEVALSGPLGCLVVIEGSCGGDAFVPAWSSGEPADRFVGVYKYLRARKVRGVGAVSLQVLGPAAEDQRFAELVVPPPPEGAGTPLNVSAWGPEKTVVVAGTYSGVVVIEGASAASAVLGSGTFRPVGQLSGSAGILSVRGNHALLRVRRHRGMGQPVVHVGAGEAALTAATSARRVSR
jgi:hypothetical protein